ncbi:hypothetical protein E2C01_039263 [Portunus trituberculatus]|uniref:Uncharacterized protein n=1 Tax=Portunus trituberculatus TaxID=210409 RepID=A0A5B7FD68_PORTR|nr:hypothetical protein [Portunus trituberculatus]
MRLVNHSPSEYAAVVSCLQFTAAAPLQLGRESSWRAEEEEEEEEEERVATSSRTRLTFWPGRKQVIHLPLHKLLRRPPKSAAI